MLHAQAFAPPVPAWPVGKEALLKALSEWVHAEADAVLFAVPGRGDKAVKLYVKLLKQWAGRIGGGQGWAIPRVGAGLREAARAVGRDECTFDALFECMQRHNARVQARHRASVEDALARLEASNKLMHREGRIHQL